MRNEKGLMMGGVLVASLCGGILAGLLFGAHDDAQGPAVVTTPQLNLVDGSVVLRGVPRTRTGWRRWRSTTPTVVCEC